MLNLVIALARIIFTLGIIYICIILCFVVKVRKCHCNGKIRLEEASQKKIEYADIPFIEEVSSKLHHAGYSWLGDYEVKGLRGLPIKMCTTDSAEMTYYARYFIEEKNGIIGTIFFCSICEEEHQQLIYKKEQYVTAFCLETAFQGEEHIISSMMSHKQFEGRKLLKRMLYPTKEQHDYKSVQEAEKMIQEHEMWGDMLKQTRQIDPAVLKWELEDILTYWNQQAYTRDKKHFKYIRKKEYFIPTLTYAITLVVKRPLLSLFKK